MEQGMNFFRVVYKEHTVKTVAHCWLVARGPVVPLVVVKSMGSILFGNFPFFLVVQGLCHWKDTSIWGAHIRAPVRCRGNQLQGSKVSVFVRDRSLNMDIGWRFISTSKVKRYLYYKSICCYHSTYGLYKNYNN